MEDLPQPSAWGGTWTEDKLGILRDYLTAYLTVMSNQRDRFRLGYIDAFAGAGERPITDTERAAQADATAFRDGSARIATALDPGFDRYVFIEKSRAKCAMLRALKAAHPDATVEVVQGEANAELQRLAARDWRRHRAVAFLDPYGMQVDFDTIRALASTQSIDLWLLAPLGIGPVRMLANRLDHVERQQGWTQRLDRYFGDSGWRDFFYGSRSEALRANNARRGTPSLFDHSEEEPGSERFRKVDPAEIGTYFRGRLEDAFPHVATPRILYNSQGSPLYMLCFACSNPSPRAGGAALRIAEHLLRKEKPHT